MKKLFVIMSLLLSALANYVSYAATEQSVNIGILQPLSKEEQKTYANGKNKAVIVLAFKKHSGNWEAFDSKNRNDLPNNFNWTIVLDGHSIGQLNSDNWPKTKWPGSEDNTIAQLIPSNKKLPLYTKPRYEFEHWLGSSPYRPLVLINPANTSDPEHWKQTSLSVQSLAAAIPVLKKYLQSKHRATAN